VAEVFIGTSGFSYPHWGSDVFYPKGLPELRWFEYYTQHFNSVELNVSFYRLPKKETFAAWRKTAGENFVFSVKGSRFITHIKRLKDYREPLENFFKAAQGLKWEVGDGKLENEVGSESLENQDITPQNPASHLSSLTSKHVILWQLPPNLKQDIRRLEEFLSEVRPPGRSDLLGKPRLTWRHAFEFRHESWVDGQTWEVLRKHKAAVVFQDWPEWPITREVTADFVYLRFHGNRELYSSNYKDEELKVWAKKIGEWLGQGRDVYIYFNNDAQGFATANALTLKELVEK